MFNSQSEEPFQGEINQLGQGDLEQGFTQHLRTGGEKMSFLQAKTTNSLKKRGGIWVSS